MEMLIVILVVGLLAAVGLFFKFSTDEGKEKTKTDDAKAKRIADLEAEQGRKDQELKKALGEIQRIEDAYYQAKNDVDIAKKESSELTARLKPLEKSKDDQGQAKEELKQKSMLLDQETTARQKLQGEIALRERELEKTAETIRGLEKKLAEAEAQVKAKTEMYEGLKGQFAELEAEVQKSGLKGAQDPKQGPPDAESPKNGDEPPKPEPPKPEPPKPAPPKPEPPKPEGPVGDIPEGTFKLTNVNKPAPPASGDEKKENKDKEKSKSRRETLIPGFQPKEKRLPEEP